MKKQFLYTLLLTLIFSKSMATHIVGGEIYYDCLGNNNYKITLKIYRDCCPSCSQFDSPSAVIGVYNSNGDFLNIIDMGWPVITPVSSFINNPCFTTPTDVCVEEGYYETTVNLPPIAGGYTLAYQRCCRNSSIINIFNAPDVGSTYQTQILDTSIVACNNTPRFNNFPPLFICQQVPLHFNNSATDPDGDSLFYEMCTPFEGADPSGPQPNPPSNPPYSFVNYNAPYSGSYPMSSSPALAINTSTGIVTGTPNMLGRWVVGVCVREYRNGVLLTTNKRDFQFNVLNCPNLPVSVIPAQQSFCNGFNVNFSQSSLNAFSFLWDFGVPNVTTDTSNLTSPSFTYPASGTYTVSLTINPGSLCADVSTNVFTIQPLLNPSFTIPSAQCILGNSFNFFAGGSFQGNGTFNWNFGSNAIPSNSNVQNPNNIHFTTAGTHTVILTISENGCTKSFSGTVMVYGMPNAMFSVSTIVGCALNPVQFTNNSAGFAPLNYQWNLDNGQFSTLQNPVTTYTAVGTYDVELIVTSAQGCKDTAQLTNQLFIVDSTLATFSYTKDCSSYQINFNSQNAIGAYFYDWDFGVNTSSVDTSSNANPSYVFPGPGVYNVKLILNPGSDCTDQITIPITILPLLQAAILAPAGQCDYLNNFNFNGGGVFNSSPVFLWNFGANATPTTSSLQNPSNVVFNQAGVFPVSFTISENGCSSTSTQNVVVYEKPQARFAIKNTTNCELRPTYFVDSSTCNTALTYLWDFGDGQTSTFANPSHIYNTAGTYFISLIVTSANNCKDTAYSTNPLVVNPTPTAGFDFYPKDTNIYYPTVTVYDLSVGATGCLYLWGDGTSTPYCDTTHTYQNVEVYFIKQIVSNSFGCTDTAYAKIAIVPPFYFWLPNAFTPDENNLNDVFKPVLEGVYDYSFTIFDRWGEMIFRTNDYKEGWDGTHQGQLAMNDVYVYKISFKDVWKNKTHEYTGAVTLVR
jgi:gliding motility-associated-like protein